MKTNTKTTAESPGSAKPLPVNKLQREIEARDETIRLLNEALSQALDELNALHAAA
jgi:hypothetical protein